MLWHRKANLIAQRLGRWLLLVGGCVATAPSGALLISGPVIDAPHLAELVESITTELTAHAMRLRFAGSGVEIDIAESQEVVQAVVDSTIEKTTRNTVDTYDKHRTEVKERAEALEDSCLLVGASETLGDAKAHAADVAYEAQSNVDSTTLDILSPTDVDDCPPREDIRRNRRALVERFDPLDVALLLSPDVLTISGSEFNALTDVVDILAPPYAPISYCGRFHTTQEDVSVLSQAARQNLAAKLLWGTLSKRTANPGEKSEFEAMREASAAIFSNVAKRQQETAYTYYRRLATTKAFRLQMALASYEGTLRKEVALALQLSILVTP